MGEGKIAKQTSSKEGTTLGKPPCGNMTRGLARGTYPGEVSLFCEFSWNCPHTVVKLHLWVE